MDEFDEFASLDEQDEDMNINDIYNEDYMDSFSDGGGMPPMQSNQGLLKDLMNFDSNLNELKCTWLGLRWDSKINNGNGAYVRDKFKKPMINIKGWQRAEEIFRTYLKGSHFLTHLGDKEYNQIMRDVIHDIWFAFPFHMKEYGIKNAEDLYAICTQIEHTIKLLLLGAGKGGYKQFLSTTTSRSEHINLADQHGGMSGYGRQPDFEFSQNKKSKGIMGSLKSFVMGR